MAKLQGSLIDMKGEVAKQREEAARLQGSLTAIKGEATK